MTIPGYVNGVREKTPEPADSSAGAQPLSRVAALLRRHDRDRYQTALFAPAAHREALFALYAFNYEIARVRDSVNQPALGQIRLEWWRENIAAAYAKGPFGRHPVVEALAGVIRDRGLTRDHLDRLIDARDADFGDDPPSSLAALENYAEGTSSRLIYIALEVLGVRDRATMVAGRHVGVAFALSGLLRALPMRMAAGRPMIPADIAARHRLDLGDARQMHGSAALRAAVAEIAAAAEAGLRVGRGARSAVPRAALPALLPAVIADRSLRRLKRAGHNPFDPVVQRSDPWQSWRLAAAALRGRF